MMKAEILAILQTTAKARDAVSAKIDTIEAKYDELRDAETAPLKEERDALYVQLSDQKIACVRSADFFPFTRGEFITQDELDFYEVSDWSIDLNYKQDGLDIVLTVIAVRKSGTLARHSTNIRHWDGYKKAEVSAHLCLRRALKQRLRKRLEGGD